MPVFPSFGRLTDRIEALTYQNGLQSLRYVIDGSYTAIQTVQDVADEYEDETGIDTGASSGVTYDAANDKYSLSAGVAATGGTAIGNLTGSGGLAAVFDGDTGTYGQRIGATGNHIGRDWGSGNDEDIAQIELTIRSGLKIDGGAGTTNITKCDLYGSADGTIGSDTLLESLGPLVNDDDGQVFTLSVSADTTGYQALYLEIDHDGGAECDIAELVFRRPASLAMDLISSGFTAAAQPSKVWMVSLLEWPLGPGITPVIGFRASRDDGSNWCDAVAPFREAEFLTDIGIFSAALDLSGQPAGTDMRYRIGIENRDIPVHATYFMWGD